MPSTNDEPTFAPDRLPDEMVNLRGFGLTELRSVWQQRFGSPPSIRSVELLRFMLAWRIQVHQHGGLDKATRSALKRSGSPRAEGLDLGIGAVLRREWKGKIVEVIVEEDGFRMGDTLHASLSAAATAISGSRWNGPRFFGLRTRASS